MKTRFWRFAASAAVLFSGLFPAIASAETTSQAIKVNGCVATAATHSQTWLTSFGTNVTQPGIPPVLMIDFANTSQKSISSVEFGLVENGRIVAMVRDVGTFAPNASVMHAYGIRDTGGSSSAEPASCVPLAVHYTDGTAWMNSNMPAH